MSQTVDGDPLSLERRTCLRRNSGVFIEHVFHAVDSQTLALEVGKYKAAVAFGRLTQPSPQDGHRRLCKRRAALFPAFPYHANVCASAEHKIFARDPSDFRQ